MSVMEALVTPLSRMRGDVCGLDIDMFSDFDLSSYVYPCLSRVPLVQHAPHTDSHIFSTLMPENAEIVSLLTNLYGDTYMHMPQFVDKVTLCKPAYSAAHMIGCDSVCHGFMYRDKQACTRIGLFDTSQICGNSQRELVPVDRHVELYKRLRDVRTDRSPTISYHWSGYEESCMHACLDRNDSFDIRGVVRVPVVLHSESAPLVRVLPGIHT